MWRDGDWKAGDEEKVARLLRGTVRRRPGTTLPHLLHALPVPCSSDSSSARWTKIHPAPSMRIDSVALLGAGHTNGRRERRCAGRGAVDGARWRQCVASFRWWICSSPSRGSSTSQAPTSSCAISKAKSWETCVFSSFFLLQGLTTLDWINRT